MSSYISGLWDAIELEHSLVVRTLFENDDQNDGDG